MAIKRLEVVVCDLCTSDRPAVAHREIDVCNRHDQQIAARTEGAVAIVCGTCGKSFGSRSGLRQHERVEHPDVREREAGVECVLCHRMFLNNSGLGAHRLRAHGIKGTVKKQKVAS